MKNEIKIPSMGESISEAIIGTILIPSGAEVKADDAILEIETDKVNQQLYAPQSGILQLNIQSGDTVKIGQIIGHVEESKTSQATSKEPDRQPESVSQAKDQPQKERPRKEEQQKEETKEKELSSKIENIPQSKERLRQTKEEFIAELKTEPVVSASQTTSAKMAFEQTPSTDSSNASARETRKKMSTIRKVIARRLTEVQQTTAMLTTFNEIDLTQVIQLREKYKDSFIKKYGVKLGFMSFFVKAVVAALKLVPELNSYIDAEEIVHREYYDIGVAVGTDRGLFVPVIRHCDHLSFADIESQIESFAKKAKEGKIKVEDLEGGGFTITNGGVYGSLLSTPILNSPQSGILGMHKIEKRPVVIDDQVVIRSMMYVALSYDHRIVDGKEAVAFLVHIKNELEDPSRLLLEI